jgi:NADH:flavin oxidoreductase / NADH oxidase family/Pyridine nucleotide-disulphide oxidoreductase
MGSEGYLVNQFLAPRTNKHTDSWGGTPANRRRFPTEIVRRTRLAVGAEFIICYRMSMADYVEDGQSWDEIVALATEVENAVAVSSAQRGHHVTLFEANDFLGGHFDLARRIPGQEEFNETIRYFSTMLGKHGVDVRLGSRVRAADLTGYDEVVLATGVAPRLPAIPGIDHPKVVTYVEAITGAKPVGKTVAVVGGGASASMSASCW